MITKNVGRMLFAVLALQAGLVLGVSEKAEPQNAVPKPAVPNILLVLTDDVGFAASSTFGGPVPTPNLDQLAREGLRYNRFHTTGICSPTRASLLTGRNHHAVGVGAVVEMATPHPGYTAEIPRSAASIASVLRDNGYSTAMFGKDHNIPDEQRSPAGPFDQWPTRRGFDYFYGFIGGDTDQWRPALYEGTARLDETGLAEKLLDERLSDRAINWLHHQQAAAPGKPFFIYYAPGTAHAPHQAPKEWIARFRGQFDQGWDAIRESILEQQKALGLVPAATQLAERPAQIPAWDSLSPAQQAVYARYMEVFAGMLAFQDAQFGRLLNEIKRMGMADNTLVVFIQGDNGGSGEGGLGGSQNEVRDMASASGEKPESLDWLHNNLDLFGGPETYQGYPAGWAFATSTPFPWMKQIASHLGAVRNGLVVSWPQGIQRKGEIRPQYHHVIDIFPTLLDSAGIELPSAIDGVPQQPLDGLSMVYSFDQPTAASRRETQYFESVGNRAIYHKGWLANTKPRNLPWNIARFGAGGDTATYEWQLFNLDADFSQSTNLADSQPAKLDALLKVFEQEARANQVYPVQDSGAAHRAMQRIMSSGQFRTTYDYWGTGISVPMAAAPPIFALPFSLTADIQLDERRSDGVIAAAGSYFGGWSFYLDKGRPAVAAVTSPHKGGQSQLVARKRLGKGRHQLEYTFKKTRDGGELVIKVDDEEVARKIFSELPVVMAGLGESFDTGRDTLVPVLMRYQDGGFFPGEIHHVGVRLMLPTP